MNALGAYGSSPVEGTQRPVAVPQVSLQRLSPKPEVIPAHGVIIITQRY